jgi:hypothetical protein
MIRRKRIGTVVAGIVMGVAALPLVAFAAANTAGLKQFKAEGVGTGSLASGPCASPAIACAPAHTCECLIGAETILASPVFNKGSFTFELSIDETSSPLPISTVGDCLPATGFGTINSSNGKSTLLIDVSGLACPTTENAAETFNGTFHVTGGTGGKSPNTHGTGSINGSLEGTVSRVNIDGNIQP